MISLQLDALQSLETLQAKTTRVFESFTPSCVMLVLLKSPVLGLNDQTLLKPFDRRFLVEFRDMWNIDFWTSDIELGFQQFVIDRSGSDFIKRLNTDYELVEKEGSLWNTLRNEAWVHYRMQSSYSRETETYHILRDTQEKYILRLFASVNIPNSPSSQFTDVSGILVE